MRNDNFNSRIVDDMAKRIRELELQKIDYMEQRFKETQKQLILKEKKAKRNLVEVDEENKKIKRKSQSKSIHLRYLGTPEINPWEVQQNYYDDKWKIQNPIQPLPTLSLNRKYSKRLSIDEKENENSIPKLKCLLRNLESPEKKFDKNKNITLDFNDLYTKRKNSTRIADILKVQQQWTNTPSQGILRPISNRALNNHHGSSQLIPIRFGLFKNQNKNSKKNLNENKQSEIMVKIVKQKRNQQDFKFMNETVTPKQECEYNMLKRDKFKERLTLLKLLS